MQDKIRVLIVDDEEIMRNLFTDILKEEGYDVTTVCNGKEAEEIVKKEPFDVAFVDVHMPIMDGVKTMYLLRKISPDTAVVMMDSMPKYVLGEFTKDGAITCIHKPFNINEVKSVVNGIIKKGKKDG